MSYQTLLNSVFNLPLLTDEAYAVMPTVPSDCLSPFEMIISYDQDIHVMPSLNMDGDYKNPYEKLFYPYEDYPTLTGFLKILAVAMEQDKEARLKASDSIDDAEILIDQIIENHAYPKVEEKRYSIIHDDNGGNLHEILNLSFDSMGVYLSVQALDGLRFRTYFGGGKKHRVRNALLMICFLIKNNKTT